MSYAQTMQPKDIELLRKIWALADSPNVGEAAAARSRAAALVAKYGLTTDDIPKVLAKATGAESKPASGDFFWWDFDEAMEERSPGFKAAQTKEREERARTRAAYRAAVLRKYGSKEAALAPTPAEQAVETAAAPFKRNQPKKFANGIFNTDTLDGWSDMPGEQVPERVRHAIEQALPLPATILDAKAEYDVWLERDRELEAVLGGTIGDSYLSRACGLRRDIVRDLLETGLRAQTMADVLARQRYLVGLESTLGMDLIMDAMLADLEHLSGTASQQPVQNGRDHETVSDRRAEVIRLLSNVDAMSLSDREIARRVGVSPQTVGNIRRWLQEKARSEAKAA